MKVAYKEGVTAMAELATAFEERPKKKASQAKRGRKDPIRTELLPDWFYKPYVKPILNDEQKAENEQRQKEIQAMLAKLHDTSPETGLHAF